MSKRFIFYFGFCLLFITIGVIGLNSQQSEPYSLLLDIAQEEAYVDVEQTYTVPLDGPVQMPEYNWSDRYVDGKEYTGVLKLISTVENVESKTMTGIFKGRLEVIVTDPFEE